MGDNDILTFVVRGNTRGCFQIDVGSHHTSKYVHSTVHQLTRAAHSHHSCSSVFTDALKDISFLIGFG
jgi:hypothetical protein